MGTSFTVGQRPDGQRRRPRKERGQPYIVDGIKHTSHMKFSIPNGMAQVHAELSSCLILCKIPSTPLSARGASNHCSFTAINLYFCALLSAADMDLNPIFVSPSVIWKRAVNQHHVILPVGLQHEYPAEGAQSLRGTE